MAVSQPLTSSCHDLSPAELTGRVNVDAPDVQRVHMALDACAAESGAFRFEEAVVGRLPDTVGQVFLLQKSPSPALAELMSAAPVARGVFDKYLGLPIAGSAPRGPLTVVDGKIEETPASVPMSVFLAALERDPQVTPSSLERLFEELEAAEKAGLVAVSASSIALTDAGRQMVSEARGPLRAVSDEAIETIDLYAQEVADGRMTLKEALEAAGQELGLSLPEPGQEIVEDTDVQLGVTVRTGTTALQGVFAAAWDIPEEMRLDVVVAGLVAALSKLGVEEEAASDRVRNDLRLLRLFGASLSHGLPDLKEARARLEPEHMGLVDLFESRLTDAMVAPLLLERRREEQESNVATESARTETLSFCARLMRRLGFNV